MRKLLRGLIACVVLALAACEGQHEGPGTVTSATVPPAAVAARQDADRAALAKLAPGEPPAKQVLFGDLHVHTTFSVDAFMISLPMLQGEGTHPPADACDFARFCSALDFWSINDHAEGITPRHWEETKEAIRQCNEVAGNPANPDMVTFLGWEWTQVGTTAAEHYGHKNVVLKDTAEDRVPARPISAISQRLVGALLQQPSLWQRLQFPLFDWPNRQRYYDMATFLAERREVPACPEGVDARQLPASCHESAQTPQVLYEKLSQLGFDTIVIPHGTTWGFYTPPDASWDKQLTAAQHDPEKQTLIEVYSGHGNAEEYRDWRPVTFDAAGNATCPAPSPTYLPCCWQAGELIRSRCGAASPAECERRVAAARANYVAAGVSGFRTVPGASVEDWKDCGQCRDCFDPAFSFRPANSVQYTLAISNFDDPKAPRRFQFGFIASSDNHKARPGTGFKEFGRRMMTEATGARSAAWRRRVLGPEPAASAESVPFDPVTSRLPGFAAVDTERQASFFLTGGLVAVHAEGRDRQAVWNALKRREVYGTSGDRMLLWFDLLNGPAGAQAMGTEARLAEAPRFRVRAVGAFKQQPGCPDYVRNSLTPERMHYLCRGECYNPSDERKLITRIEVVRIRPQIRPGEPVRDLIEDPWRTISCPPDAAGCEAQFTDPDFVPGARPATYYVRAIQEPSLAVNAANVRCTYDAKGNCTAVAPCFGDYRTPYEDDCLAPNEERAWSSPIYLSAANGA